MHTLYSGVKCNRPTAYTQKHTPTRFWLEEGPSHSDWTQVWQPVRKPKIGFYGIPHQHRGGGNILICFAHLIIEHFNRKKNVLGWYLTKVKSLTTPLTLVFVNAVSQLLCNGVQNFLPSVCLSVSVTSATRYAVTQTLRDNSDVILCSIVYIWVCDDRHGPA